MALALLLAAGMILAASGCARSELLRLLGAGSPGPSATSRVNWPIVTLLILSLLLVTTLPEARIFLLFIDAVGLDFFLLLLTLQCRAYLFIARDHFLAPTWRQLKTFGPFPMDLPTLCVMRDFPYQSTCAVAGIMVSASFLLALVLIFTAPVGVWIIGTDPV